MFLEKENLKSKIALRENLEEFDEATELTDELATVNDKISAICAEKNRNIVNEYLKDKNDTVEGFNQAKTWSMKKKLAPKNTIDPPAAKKDEEGNLVTNKEELENLYLRTYQRRLQPNPVSEEFQELKMLKEYLLDIQLKLARTKVTKDWTLDDLNKALKSFKNNKARDYHGHII